MATAVTILAAVVILCAVAGLLWIVAEFLQRFSSVFLPLAVGAVAALVFNPYFEWLPAVAAAGGGGAGGGVRLHPGAAGGGCL